MQYSRISRPGEIEPRREVRDVGACDALRRRRGDYPVGPEVSVSQAWRAGPVETGGRVTVDRDRCRTGRRLCDDAAVRVLAIQG